MKSMRVAAFLLLVRLAALSAPVKPPVWFEPNRGQAGPDVVLVGHTGSSTLLLERTRIVLCQKDGSSLAIVPETAGRSPLLEPEDPSGAISNYFSGADASRWVRRVPQFRRARYRAVYPGIDLMFHDSGTALEYDLIVAPGADPRAIRLRYDGAKRLSLDAEGNLDIWTETGRMQQKRPLVFQEFAGRRREVAGRFLVDGTRVRFQVGSYDRRRALTIDPVVVYGTYLGGVSNDAGRAVAVDSAGSAYVAGYTVSADFPVTPNAVQVKHGGIPNPGVSGLGGTWVYDAFVSKFSPDGSKLIYSTFLGGYSTDEAQAIAVDRSGNAIVAGWTGSPNFPLANGAIQKSIASGAVAGFVTKLNADGSDLLYSTYLGGLGSYSTVQALAIDAAGAVYAGGITDAGQFPTSSGALQTAANGPLDGYVAKINPQGTALVYATRLGGSDRDFLYGIAVNAAGNAYVTGYTQSTDFPVTSAAAQPKSGGGADVFVAELNPTGTALVYSTLLGGSGSDIGNAIALDTDGSMVVAGSTDSPDFPVSLGAFQTTRSGNLTTGFMDAFVARLTPAGAVQYATYLGGSGPDSAVAVAVAADGSAVVTGSTQSGDFPLTPDAYQRQFLNTACVNVNAIIPVTGSFPSCYKTFLTIVHVSGRRLVYSTFLGGSDSDTPGGMALGADGTIYLTGGAGSADFPVTQGAFQTQKRINTCLDVASPSFETSYACADAFLLKIDPTVAGPARIVAGIANATNGVQGDIAPGEIVALIGIGIGPSPAAGAQLDARGYLATTLEGTSVYFNEIAAPLLYVSANQINAVVPFEIAGQGTAVIRIISPTYAATVASANVAATAPGLVSLSGAGQQQAAALNQDGSLNSAANPAAAGSIIVLYGTGAGQTSPAGITGHLASSSAPLPVANITVNIGGLPAQVLYAGDAPELVEGALQINAVIPPGVAASNSVPVVMTAGGKASQPLLTIAVK